MEEQYPKQALDKFRQWHFWWLVVFSVLLIVAFVYYLPARFLNQLSQDDHVMEEMHEEMDDEMMADEHDNGDEHASGYEYHEEADVKDGLVVNMNFSFGRLDFKVNIPVSELEVEHEKIIHVIGIRSDMNEFFHIHPVQNNENTLSADYEFKKPGRYKMWSEIKKDGIVHAFGHPEITVQGVGLTEEKIVSFGRNVVVGDYQVSLEHDEPIVANDESKLYFTIRTLVDEGVELEDYLGVPMHLAIIKDDLKSFIHIHPKEEDHEQSFNIINEAGAHGGVEDEHEIPEEVVEFSVEFPKPGLYKTFAQFRPVDADLRSDEALLAEFWIQVDEKSPGVVKKDFDPWWALLGVSIFLIVILSWIVKKYITVK